MVSITWKKVTGSVSIPFDEREAMHTRLRAKLDGVVMDYDVFVLKKDGCVYDFVYVADPAKSEGGAVVFEQFVETFHTLPGAGNVT